MGGAAAPGAARADNLKGALMLALAALAFTAEATLVRLIGPDAAQAQLVAARGLLQLAAVGLWILATDPARLRTRRPLMHLARGATSLLCWWLYYASFRSLDFALATTLTFTSSLFVVALAGPVLGERVGAWRWAMTVLGFAGVVLAAAPAGLASLPGVGMGLGAAAAAAALVFLNRILARTEATATIMFHIGLVASLGALPFAILDWRPLAPGAAALVLAAAGLGATGMMLTIEAYRVGEVSALAPVPYLRLVFAIAVGAALFGEMPTLAMLAGSALIVACSLMLRPPWRRRGLRAPLP